MKTGISLFALASLTLISTWGLSGCSKQEHANAHAKHAEAQRAGHEGEAHGKHDHHKDGHKGEEHPKHDHHKASHKRGEHKHHEHGEHREETPPQGKVKVGDKVPDFSVRTLDGKSAKLSELQKDEKRTMKGVIVLSFWCTTCHSCRDVEHLLAKLHKDYEGQAAVIALDANADETAEGVAAFVKKNGLEMPIVLDASGSTADLFGVKRTTTTVVIDGNGVLRYCGQFRQKDGGSAEEALKTVLAGKEVTIRTTPHKG